MCRHRFRNDRRERTLAEHHLWYEYVFHKQTFREISDESSHVRRTIRRELNAYVPPQKIHHPRPVHLLADSTFFGKRTNDSSWCVTVLKCADTGEDLWWNFSQTETASAYYAGKVALESLGYIIHSVTGDGFGGIRTAFSGTSFQMCHVHMERIVIRGTTLKPKTEAGVVLLAMIRTLFSDHTNHSLFYRRLQLYWQKYQNFLNERTTAPISGETFWTHEELRKSVMTLQRLSPYLFTFEKDLRIPKTTNALEGQFSHLKEVLAIHRGVSRKNKEKMIHTILLESTIAPKEG